MWPSPSPWAGALAIAGPGLKFGIDFSGGTAIAVRFKDRPDVDKLRKTLDGANLGEIGIQRYEEADKNEVLIRVQQQAKEVLAEPGHPVFGLVDRTWAHRVSEVDSAAMAPADRVGLDRLLDLYHWIEMYSPTLELS